MTDPAPHAAPVLVPYERLCVRCSYNLVGLPVEGVCPECAYPIADSLRGNLLRHASPEFLGSLHRGVTLIEWAIVAKIVAAVVPQFLVALLGVSRSLLSLGIAPLLALGAEGALLWGWWHFTTPDPGHPGDNQGDRARRITRVTAVIGTAVTLVELVGLSFVSSSGIAVPQRATFWTIFLFKAGAFIAWFFASMIYVRWLAPRIPSPRIDRFAATLMWLGPVAFVVGAPLCMIGPVGTLVAYLVLIDMIRREIGGVRRERGLAGPGAASAHPDADGEFHESG